MRTGSPLPVTKHIGAQSIRGSALRTPEALGRVAAASRYAEGSDLMPKVKHWRAAKTLSLGGSGMLL